MSLAKLVASWSYVAGGRHSGQSQKRYPGRRPLILRSLLGLGIHCHGLPEWSCDSASSTCDGSQLNLGVLDPGMKDGKSEGCDSRLVEWTQRTALMRYTADFGVEVIASGLACSARSAELGLLEQSRHSSQG